MSDSDSFGKFQLSLYDTGRYMRLDSAAQRALNVLKQRTDANDNFSLYGLMNKGRTVMARRLLKVRQLSRFSGKAKSWVEKASELLSCNTLRLKRSL